MKLNLPRISKKLPKINIPPPRPLPKPKVDMKILQKSVGYITDIVSVVPFVRPILMATKVGLNVVTKGESGKYLKDDQKSNSGWNMAPGGSLIQRSLNDITKGKSGDWISKNTIDIPKLSLSVINKNLPPKYNPTKIIPTLLQNNDIKKNTLTRPIEFINKPSLLPFIEQKKYIPPSTIAFRKIPFNDTGKSIGNITKQPILPPYIPISIEKEIIKPSVIEYKEPTSTLANSYKPIQVSIPTLDKFNRIENKVVEIEQKNTNFDMTIPVVTILGICLILYIRK